MRILVAFVLFCLPLRLFAAVGDITGAATSTNGSILFLYVSGVASNGTWLDYGLGPNNTLTGREKVRVSVSGHGFNSSGAVVTNQRTIVGTVKYPSLYPATNVFETSDGSTAALQITLSDSIFAGEVATVDVLAGLYTQGGVTNNAASAVSVTNSAILTYALARPSFVWMTPHVGRATSSTYRVEFWADHWSALYHNDGRPVQAVEMRAADELGNSVTQIVTMPVLQWSRFGVPRANYVWDVPLTTLSDTNSITVNARVLPMFGTNTTETIDTSDGTYSYPSPNYCPLKFLNDKNGTYGVSVANVATNGSDATGAVTNAANYSTNLAAFLTIRGAANAMALFNSNNFGGRIDVGGSVVYLNVGRHRWTGTNLAVGQNMPRAPFTVTRMPHLGVADATIYTNTSSQDITDRIVIDGITIEGENTAGGQIFTGIDVLHFKDCDIATGQGAAFFVNTNWSFSGCRFYWMKQGIAPFSGSVGPAAFVIDSLIDLTNTGTAIQAGVLIGNLKTNSYGLQQTIQNQNAGFRPRPVTVWVYNQFYGVTNTSSDIITFKRDNIQSDYIGGTIAGNIIEAISDTSLGVASIYGTATSSNAPNTKIWNNSFPGVKINWFYDDGSGGAEPKYYSPSWAGGNLFEDTNIKGDTFSPADGGRFGNRPQMFSVGWSYNVFPEVYNVGAAGSFQQPFFGLGSYSTNSITTNTFIGYLDGKAWVTSIGAGRGDYRLRSDSKLWQLPNGNFILPFDSRGTPRGRLDPAGAHTSGNVRKGAFF